MWGSRISNHVSMSCSTSFSSEDSRSWVGRDGRDGVGGSGCGSGSGSGSGSLGGDESTATYTVSTIPLTQSVPMRNSFEEMMSIQEKQFEEEQSLAAIDNKEQGANCGNVDNGEYSQETRNIARFLQHFRKGTGICLANAYSANRPVEKSDISGNVTLSLAEDIFFLIDVQLKVLDDYLLANGFSSNDTGEEILVDGLLSTFRNLWSEQARNRDLFLTCIDRCCAAANDFGRMADHMDEFMTLMEQRYPQLEWNAFDGDGRVFTLRKEAQDLSNIFNADAIYAAERVHVYIMEAVRKSSTVTNDLFNRDWEDKYTHNEVILQMVRTFEDYANDIQNSLLTDFLYHKVVIALSRATATFYLHQLILKATKVKSASRRANQRRSRFYSSDLRLQQQMPFASPSRALCRMMYDIQILQNYFRNVAKTFLVCARTGPGPTPKTGSTPQMKLEVESHLSILTLVHEFLSLAVNHSGLESLEEFIIVIHKHIGTDIDVTKHFLSDLWFLTSPVKDRNLIHVAVGMVRAELQIVSDRIQENKNQHQQQEQRRLLEQQRRSNYYYSYLTLSSTTKKDHIPTIKHDHKEALSRLEYVLKSMYEDRIWQEKLSAWAPCLKA